MELRTKNGFRFLVSRSYPIAVSMRDYVLSLFPRPRSVASLNWHFACSIIGINDYDDSIVAIPKMPTFKLWTVCHQIAVFLSALGRTNFPHPFHHLTQVFSDMQSSRTGAVLILDINFFLFFQFHLFSLNLMIPSSCRCFWAKPFSGWDVHQAQTFCDFNSAVGE